MVRWKAREAYTQYAGDILVDKARVRATAYVRPDRRLTKVIHPDDDPSTPYERHETVGE
jgi:hypothetical protein